jgi:hypothetical protein
MQITSRTINNEDSECTILVEIAYRKIACTFLVTIDKIIGGIVVHHNGFTRKTSDVELSNPDDVDVLEEAAVLAAIHFPTTGT